MSKHYDLDTPLIEFTKDSCWTIRDAVQGCAILGGIGSGKSSGSGRMMALKYLQAGFGGLVLTVKTDEKWLWQEYCRDAGRLDDLVIIEPGSQHKFNFLDFESANKERTYTANIVAVLNTVIRAGKERESKSGNDEFWQDALTLTMTNVIDLCLLAYDKVTVQQVYDIFLTAPKKEEQKSKETDSKPTAFQAAFLLAQKRINEKMEAWERSQPKGKLAALEADGELEEARMKAVPEAKVLTSIYSFFIEKYKSLQDKTRGIIDFSFMGFLFRLLQEPVYSLLCSGKSTITPDDCLDGKIILLNLPIKTYDQVGRDSQVMFKYIWQRAMERRDITKNDRPVFLWADEAQYVLHPNDSLFQTTARSSRIATVYLTQNISNYYAYMGGSQADHTVKSFLGTLATKIFHANADFTTNHYASELIGDAWMDDHSQSKTLVGNFSFSSSKSKKLQRLVRPEEFVSLPTGGPLNKFLTGCYFHRQGNAFPEGRNHRRVVFNQKFHL